MFGRNKPAPQPIVAARRHGRRPIRSSLTGPQLPDPDGRVLRFEVTARAALELLRHHLGDEIAHLRVGVATAPSGEGTSSNPMFYSVDRDTHTIILFRMPIQRAKGLHVDDAEHRRFFVGHCVHLAVCEYLGREPWEVMPGHFDHF